VPKCPIRQTRVQRQEETRRRLLAAAADVFARRGYDAASLEEIAAAAGFTRGAVYSNFRDKDELFVTYLEDCMAVETATFERLLREAPDWPQRIASVGAYYARAHGKASALFYAELHLAGVRHSALRRKLRPLFDRQLESFARVVADVGGDTSATFKPTFLAMFAAVHGIALQRAAGVVDEATAEAALRLVFNALGTHIAPAGAVV
jgi:AcrR family transcriptional regulator